MAPRLTITEPLREWAGEAWNSGEHRTCSGSTGPEPSKMLVRDTLLRLAEAIHDGTVSALDALRALQFPTEAALRFKPCHCPPSLPEAPSAGFHLYRLFDADGRLLYVGVSRRLKARLLRHKARWGNLVARIEWEDYPDEQAMLEAERVAIATEMPALNKAGV